MKEQRKKGKDAQNSDPMAEMRKRYERAVEADRENRDNALDDLRFVTVPGYQWDEAQRKARKGRASYLGERSIGHEDPGAASTALIVAALGRALSA